MSERSSIEWTEATWNPVRGCEKISAGCKHCYASTFAERFRGVPGHAYEQGFDPLLVPHMLLDPLQWNAGRLVFVNSMSDLFQAAVPDDYVAVIAAIMDVTPWHTYQVLTKRADRMRSLLSGPLRDRASRSHVWWGVSVEDKKSGIPRISELQQTPAAVRFLSIEPLLEDLGEVPLSGIDWVIVGGESGPGARELNPEWVRSIRDQCQRASVPFFFKQWGGTRKKLTGRVLDGRTYDSMPPRSAVPILDATRRRALAEEMIDRYESCTFNLQSIRRVAQLAESTELRAKTSKSASRRAQSDPL